MQSLNTIHPRLLNKPLRMAAAIATTAITLTWSNVSLASEFRFGHYAPENHPASAAAEMFAQSVTKRTNNKIKVAVYANNKLGKPKDSLELVRTGGIEMGLYSLDSMAHYSKMADAVGTPFVFKNPAHAFKVLDSARFLEKARDEFGKSGLMLVNSWDWGFRQITNNQRPVMAPADLKGLKIRVPPPPIFGETIAALGGSPMSVNFAELPAALKAGIVDGQENPIGVIHSLKLYESQKHVAMVNYIYTTAALVVSKQVWDGLPKDQQKVIMEEADRAAKSMRKAVADGEAKELSDLRSAGVKFTYPDLTAFKTAMSPVYEAQKKRIGNAEFEAFMTAAK